MKKNEWIATDTLLLYVIDIQGDKYTIFTFMKIALDALFIATDLPKRKFQWSKDSIGLKGTKKDCKEFIKYVFNKKIIYTELNKD